MKESIVENWTSGRVASAGDSEGVRDILEYLRKKRVGEVQEEQEYLPRGGFRSLRNNGTYSPRYTSRRLRAPLCTRYLCLQVHTVSLAIVLTGYRHRDKLFICCVDS